MAIQSLTENITPSVHDKMHAVGVSMNIWKALDAIDHNILLKNEPLWT